jgi:hypothetical protein
MPTPDGSEIGLHAEHVEADGGYDIVAKMTRRIVTAEVLDYDGMNGNYALIWKKITCEQSQVYKEEINFEHYQSDEPNCFYRYIGPSVGLLEKDMIPEGVISDKSESIREVEFYLTYKVTGEDENGISVIVKKDILLATCNMTTDYYTGTNLSGISESQPTSKNHTLEGERVYVPSIQVSDNFIVYYYQLEIPTGFLNSHQGYDGNYAFESWTSDHDENLVWAFSKHIVGLININDGMGSTVGYRKEEQYETGNEDCLLSVRDVYAVGTYYAKK